MGVNANIWQRMKTENVEYSWRKDHERTKRKKENDTTRDPAPNNEERRGGSRGRFSRTKWKGKKGMEAEDRPAAVNLISDWRENEG